MCHSKWFNVGKSFSQLIFNSRNLWESLRASKSENNLSTQPKINLLTNKSKNSCHNSVSGSTDMFSERNQNKSDSKNKTKTISIYSFHMTTVEFWNGFAWIRLDRIATDVRLKSKLKHNQQWIHTTALIYWTRIKREIKPLKKLRCRCLIELQCERLGNTSDFSITIEKTSNATISTFRFFKGERKWISVSQMVDFYLTLSNQLR